jgi:sulfur dioxygenase
VIPGSVHAPYPDLEDNVKAGGILHELAADQHHQLLFYCAFGERSAMAVQAAQAAGMTTSRHIQGGIDAWRMSGGNISRNG